MKTVIFFTFFCCITLARSLPPAVPDNMEEVPAYLAEHGQQLAEAFARHRIGDLHRLGLDAAKREAGVRRMARGMIENIADAPVERQHDYLAGMHDRIKQQRQND